MNRRCLIDELNQVFTLQLQTTIPKVELEILLSKEINRLVEHDFHKLVTILYRVDVNEHKLKQLLKDNPGKDAGVLIARLMIERQTEKIRTRESLKRKAEDDGEEKW
jgi:hypothetical protein